MKFSYFLILLFGFLCCNRTGAQSDPPMACPAVEAIQNKGVAMARENHPGKYITYNFGNYNTNTNWIFYVALIDASSPKRAVEKGNILLREQLAGHPIPQTKNGDWLCVYDIDSLHHAVARESLS